MDRFVDFLNIRGDSNLMEKELKINNKIFVMSDTDYRQLNDTHRKTLQELSTLSEDVYPELHNPVYIELEQDTVLVIT